MPRVISIVIHPPSVLVIRGRLIIFCLSFPSSGVATVPELVRTDLLNPRLWDVKVKRVKKAVKAKRT